MSRRPESLPAVHEAWLPKEHALHRPRHGGRQLTALIAAAVFFATPALLWVFGGRPAEIENHKLAGFPGISAGWRMFTGLPAWASDHLVFREAAIDAADGISRGLFGEPAPLGQGTGKNTGPLPGSTPKPAPPGETGPKGDSGSQRAVVGTDGWLYFGFDAEAKCSPARPFTDTVEKLGKLRAAVRDSGRRFVLAVAPDKTTMVPQHLPANYPYKRCSRAVAAEFWRLITEQAGTLDLRDDLNSVARSLGHPLYFAKGTHWTHMGAIVLTRALAETLHPGITKTWQAKPSGSFTSTADLPPMLGRQATRTGTIYELRPNGRIDRTVPGIGSIEEPVRHNASPLNSTVNAQTLVLGDSFTLASARYLPAGFSNLTMLSYTGIGSAGSRVIQEMVDAEVVVLQVVERGLASGTVPVLAGDFIQRVRQTLAAHPR